MESLRSLLDFDSSFNGLMALSKLSTNDCQEYIYKLAKIFIESHKYELGE